MRNRLKLLWERVRSPKDGRESLRRGLVSTVGLNLCTRFVTLVQSVAVASFFGLSVEVDFFFYVTNTILLVIAFLRGANAAVLIPRFSCVEHEDGIEAATGLFNYFFSFALVLACVAALSSLVLPTRTWASVSGFSPEVIASHRSLLSLSALYLVGALVAAFLTDLLSACRSFTPALVMNLVAALLPLLFLGVDRGRHGAFPLILGATAGALASAVVLVVWAWRITPWRPWRVNRARASGAWRDIGFAQAGNTFTTAAAYILLFWLNGLGEGVVAAASFARTLGNIPRAFLVEHVSSFIGLKFNQEVARGDWAMLNRVFRQALLMLGVVLWPVCFLICICRVDIISLLFALRGHRPVAYQLVADLLAFQVLSLPFVTLDAFVSRVFMAAHEIRITFWIQVVFNLVLVAGFYLVKDRLGAAGYGHVQLWPYVLLDVFIYAFLVKTIVPKLEYQRSLMVYLIMGAVFAVLAGLAYGIVGAAGLNAIARAVVVSLLLAATGFIVFLSPLGDEVRRGLSEFSSFRRLKARAAS